ncbi:MAG: UDP-3-O-(3-hydroxymyristoyl)glucosamine N-acyltransferase [Proteobacteria bacterium]|jgi:UDP-3-O-[3-hydroxymyristoyl] glucosamine N-acyltransferase|nr:UDP-3-O-(3-hydroxymyristoyl)glucosamine N-acyltransferase [Pseudomonadota bacterium]
MFFQKSPPILIEQLAKIIGAETNVSGILISDVGPLENLDQGILGCYHNTKYKASLAQAKSGFCILKEDDRHLLGEGVIGLFTPTPYRAFGKAALYFYAKPESTREISKLADIHPTAKIGKNCQIEAFTVIKAFAEIGDNTIIRSHCVIGEHVRIGNDSLLEHSVTITNTLAGDRFYVKPGACIGQPGFGFHMDEKGHFDIPQIGCVRIGNDVQIGSNTTIDRGSQHDTIIGNFCRIDNLVQIAHNVELGDGCVIVSQVGIAGSSKLGKFVIAAGQVGIAGHLTIGDGVKIAAQSGLMRDVAPGETISGSPAIPIREWHKQTIAIQRLSKK